MINGCDITCFGDILDKMKELEELEGHDLQTSVGESRMCNQAQQEKGFRALAWTLWTYGSAQHNDSIKVE